MAKSFGQYAAVVPMQLDTTASGIVPVLMAFLVKNTMEKIYTRQGDRGQSRLKGKRVAKDSPLLIAVGSLDELMSFLGWAKLALDRNGNRQLEEIQKDIQGIMAQLAGYADVKLSGRTQKLERQIDVIWGGKSKNKFVLPGANEAEARLQLARVVCRRAERMVVRLGREQAVSGTIAAYLNRLSDFLFALAVANS